MLYLKGIHTLNISGCSSNSLSSAGFAFLKGIQTLQMGDCTQTSITDAIFVHLKGIKSLDMHGCTQDTITNSGLVHLKGITSLNISSCNQISGEAFSHFAKILRLRMNFCSSVTSIALDQLRSIRVLDLYGCDTSKTDLKDILSLSMNGSLRSVRLPDGSLYGVIADLIYLN